MLKKIDILAQDVAVEDEYDSEEFEVCSHVTLSCSCVLKGITVYVQEVPEEAGGGVKRHSDSLEISEVSMSSLWWSFC